jgi:hypothetical protein
MQINGFRTSFFSRRIEFAAHLQSLVMGSRPSVDFPHARHCVRSLVGTSPVGQRMHTSKLHGAGQVDAHCESSSLFQKVEFLREDQAART